MKLDRALKINGWMSGPELQFLAETAFKSENILEIGSFQGRSTRAMADNTNGKITCVDPWDGKSQVYKDGFHHNGDNEDYTRFYMNLYDHIKYGAISTHRTTFDKLEIDEKFDFIFIDAIHEYQAVKDDVAKALTMIKSGGILAGHDYCAGWSGVILAIEELFPNKKLVDTIWYIQIN